jgi:hypothetical protein
MSEQSRQSPLQHCASLGQLARMGLWHNRSAKVRFHKEARTRLRTLADQLALPNYRLYSHPQTPDLGGTIILEAGALWLSVTPTPCVSGQEVAFHAAAGVDDLRQRPLYHVSLDVFDTPDALMHCIQASLNSGSRSQRHTDPSQQTDTH